ncbi:MAG: sulfite exporter TauE/SafE family protein [Bacteroidales bacterium]|nr:sulfite exporter TauE/SafE family protein [Bacteroidales bacterium]
MSLSLVIAIIFVSSLAASFIQRVSGFGFGIFIMTILPLIMPSYGEATALSGLLALCNSFYIMLRMWKRIPWKKLLPILITFTVVSFFAIEVVADVDSRTLKHILGGILIVVSIYFFFISDRIKVSPSMGVQLSMGTASGLMGGFFAMQGPPAVLYFIACTESKEEYLAIAQAFFFFGNLMMTFFRASNGFVTKAVGLGWCCGIVAVFIGIWIGAKVFDRMSLPILRKVIYGYMALSGIIALLA